MHVTDVIGSYKELLPEPASQYAEIIRLNQPGLSSERAEFRSCRCAGRSCAVARSYSPWTPCGFSAASISRIHPRFRWSARFAPREPTAPPGQIHLRDAVHLAGGLSPKPKRRRASVPLHAGRQMKIFSVSLEGRRSPEIAPKIDSRAARPLAGPSQTRRRRSGHGECRRGSGQPGRYPLTTNMKVADLIRVGGGLKPSADTQAGRLTHSSIRQGKLRSDQAQASVMISSALVGRPNADLPLHNGDVLTIRQLPGWKDLGASMRCSGEVNHAGTFGIRPGEKLSSVLERAGGFQPDAYPYGAILQRAQVRELESKPAERNDAAGQGSRRESGADCPGTPQQQQARETALQQWQTTLTSYFQSTGWTGRRSACRPRSIAGRIPRPTSKCGPETLS